jgi:SPP1 gp7 family putative phage head morphogenesis protein
VISPQPGADAGEPWQQQYVTSAYMQGMTRAYVDTNKLALAGDMEEHFAGGKEQFLTSAFSGQVATDKIRLLATRNMEMLKGVNADMAGKMNRILSDGLIAGDHPTVIARRMNQEIEGITRKRALVIARTEIIHAHAEGQLDSFDAMNVEAVGGLAEWSTAGDGKVCPKCQPLEGMVLTTQEARGIIPRHPNCRCMWIPAAHWEPTTGQKWAKSSIDQQVRASLKAEGGKKTLAEARAASRWLGAAKKFGDKSAKKPTTKKRKERSAKAAAALRALEKGAAATEKIAEAVKARTLKVVVDKAAAAADEAAMALIADDLQVVDFADLNEGGSWVDYETTAARLSETGGKIRDPQAIRLPNGRIYITEEGWRQLYIADSSTIANEAFPDGLPHLDVFAGQLITPAERAMLEVRWQDFDADARVLANAWMAGQGRGDASPALQVTIGSPAEAAGSYPDIGRLDMHAELWGPGRSEADTAARLDDVFAQFGIKKGRISAAEQMEVYREIIAPTLRNRLMMIKNDGIIRVSGTTDGYTVAGRQTITKWPDKPGKLEKDLGHIFRGGYQSEKRAAFGENVNSFEEIGYTPIAMDRWLTSVVGKRIDDHVDTAVEFKLSTPAGMLQTTIGNVLTDYSSHAYSEFLADAPFRSAVFPILIEDEHGHAQVYDLSGLMDAKQRGLLADPHIDHLGGHISALWKSHKLSDYAKNPVPLTWQQQHDLMNSIESQMRTHALHVKNKLDEAEEDQREKALGIQRWAIERWGLTDADFGVEWGITEVEATVRTPGPAIERIMGVVEGFPDSPDGFPELGAEVDVLIDVHRLPHFAKKGAALNKIAQAEGYGNFLELADHFREINPDGSPGELPDHIQELLSGDKSLRETIVTMQSLMQQQPPTGMDPAAMQEWLPDLIFESHLRHELLAEADFARVPGWGLDYGTSGRKSYGGVMVNHEGQVLLRKPTGQFGGYAWTFAKGTPDAGGNPVDTALREVAEETGYTGRIFGFLPGGFEGDTSDVHMFLMRPEVGEDGLYTGHDAALMDKETEETQWVTRAEAMRLIEMSPNEKGRNRDLAILARAYQTLGEMKNKPVISSVLGVSAQAAELTAAHAPVRATKWLTAEFGLDASHFDAGLMTSDALEIALQKLGYSGTGDDEFQGLGGAMAMGRLKNAATVMDQRGALSAMPSPGGFTSGAAADLAAEQAAAEQRERAAALTVAMPETTLGLEFRMNLPGSTKPIQVADASGKLWAMKSTGDKLTPEHIRSEALADALYRELGIAVPAGGIIETAEGPVKLTEWMESGDKFDNVHLLSEWSDTEENTAKVYAGFVADALLANHDVVGMEQDNMLIVDGFPVRIDNGGALMFRAQGLPKQGFDAIVNELESMRDKGINQNTWRWFNNIDNADIHRQIAHISRKRGALLAIINSQEHMDEAKRAELATVIGNRIDYLEGLLPVRASTVQDAIDRPDRGYPTAVYQPESAEAVQRIVESRVNGTIISANGRDIEDNGILVWQQDNEYSEPLTRFNLKLTADGSAKVSDRLRQTMDAARGGAAQGSGHTRGNKPQERHDLDVRHDIFGTIEVAAKTLAIHAPNGVGKADGEYNEIAWQRLDHAQGLLEELRDDPWTELGKSKARVSNDDAQRTIDMAEEYLDMIATLRQRRADGEPPEGVLHPFGVDAPAAFDPEHLGVFPAVYEVVDRPANDFDNGHASIKHGGYPSNKLQAAGGGSPEHYVIDLGNGVIARYMPRSESDDRNERAGLAIEGSLELEYPGAVSPEIIAQARGAIKALGIDPQPPTPAFEEALYIHRTLWSGKYITRTNSVLTKTVKKKYFDIWDDRTITDVERVVRMKKWAKIALKVDLPDELSEDYDPRGFTSTSAGDGHRFWLRWDRTEQDTREHLPHEEYVLRHSTGQSLSKVIDDVLDNGGEFVSTAQRLRKGVPIYSKTGADIGMSPNADIASGGANYFMMRLNTEAEARYSHGIYFKIRNARRADSIHYLGDRYGKIKAFEADGLADADWSDSKNVAHKTNEYIFKNAVSLIDEVDFIAVGGSSARDSVIASFAKHGITVLPDGRSVEDIVITDKQRMEDADRNYNPYSFDAKYTSESLRPIEGEFVRSRTAATRLRTYRDVVVETQAAHKALFEADEKLQHGSHNLRLKVEKHEADLTQMQVTALAIGDLAKQAVPEGAIELEKAHEKDLDGKTRSAIEPDAALELMGSASSIATMSDADQELYIKLRYRWEKQKESYKKEYSKPAKGTPLPHIHIAPVPQFPLKSSKVDGKLAPRIPLSTQMGQITPPSVKDAKKEKNAAEVEYNQTHAEWKKQKKALDKAYTRHKAALDEHEELEQAAREAAEIAGIELTKAMEDKKLAGADYDKRSEAFYALEPILGDNVVPWYPSEEGMEGRSVEELTADSMHSGQLLEAREMWEQWKIQRADELKLERPTSEFRYAHAIDKAMEMENDDSSGATYVPIDLLHAYTETALERARVELKDVGKIADNAYTKHVDLLDAFVAVQKAAPIGTSKQAEAIADKLEPFVTQRQLEHANDMEKYWDQYISGLASQSEMTRMADLAIARGTTVEAMVEAAREPLKTASVIQAAILDKHETEIEWAQTTYTDAVTDWKRSLQKHHELTKSAASKEKAAIALMDKRKSELDAANADVRRTLIDYPDVFSKEEKDRAFDAANDAKQALHDAEQEVGRWQSGAYVKEAEGVAATANQAMKTAHEKLEAVQMAPVEKAASHYEALKWARKEQLKKEKAILADIAPLQKELDEAKAKVADADVMTALELDVARLKITNNNLFKVRQGMKLAGEDFADAELINVAVLTDLELAAFYDAGLIEPDKTTSAYRDWEKFMTSAAKQDLGLSADQVFTVDDQIKQLAKHHVDTGGAEGWNGFEMPREAFSGVVTAAQIDEAAEEVKGEYEPKWMQHMTLEIDQGYAAGEVTTIENKIEARMADAVKEHGTSKILHHKDWADSLAMFEPTRDPREDLTEGVTLISTPDEGPIQERIKSAATDAAQEAIDAAAQASHPDMETARSLLGDAATAKAEQAVVEQKAASLADLAKQLDEQVVAATTAVEAAAKVVEVHDQKGAATLTAKTDADKALVVKAEMLQSVLSSKAVQAEKVTAARHAADDAAIVTQYIIDRVAKDAQAKQAAEKAAADAYVEFVEDNKTQSEAMIKKLSADLDNIFLSDQADGTKTLRAHAAPHLPHSQKSALVIPPAPPVAAPTLDEAQQEIGLTTLKEQQMAQRVKKAQSAAASAKRIQEVAAEHGLESEELATSRYTADQLAKNTEDLLDEATTLAITVITAQDDPEAEVVEPVEEIEGDGTVEIEIEPGHVLVAPSWWTQEMAMASIAESEASEKLQQEKRKYAHDVAELNALDDAKAELAAIQTSAAHAAKKAQEMQDDAQQAASDMHSKMADEYERQVERQIERGRTPEQAALKAQYTSQVLKLKSMESSANSAAAAAMADVERANNKYSTAVWRIKNVEESIRSVTGHLSRDRQSLERATSQQKEESLRFTRIANAAAMSLLIDQYGVAPEEFIESADETGAKIYHLSQRVIDALPPVARSVVIVSDIEGG